MSTKIDDGGPVFPSNAACESWQCRKPSSGVTLLDWFAGEAMKGILACPEPGVDWDPDITAVNAYKQALAMLKVRKTL